MTVQRVAAFSVHTSPLAQPGRGDGGGMNIYVSSLGAALAHAGVDCDVFTRRIGDEPEIVEVEPGLRVVHLDAGPRGPLPKELLVEHLDEFGARARDFIERQPSEYDILHGHYWMSGTVAHRLKHELGLPLVSTFHTLALVKAAADVPGDSQHDVSVRTRADVEGDVVRCSDLVVASTTDERRDLIEHYGADPSRVEIIPPGVDHTLFHPDGRAIERRRLGLPDDVGIVLFAGRIQPLKGADVAIRAIASGDDRTMLLIVGDPSGPDGARELERLRALSSALSLGDRVRFVGAVAHGTLARYYRAADVCVVPSHSESFGLVALEAASCGTPVVAAAVGGLQSIVDDGRTGFLVESRDPQAYAAAIAKILDDADHAAEMGAAAVVAARRYSWHMTAVRLRRLFGDLAITEPVQCR